MLAERLALPNPADLPALAVVRCKPSWTLSQFLSWIHVLGLVGVGLLALRGTERKAKSGRGRADAQKSERCRQNYSHGTTNPSVPRAFHGKVRHAQRAHCERSFTRDRDAALRAMLPMIAYRSGPSLSSWRLIWLISSATALSIATLSAGLGGVRLRRLRRSLIWRRGRGLSVIGLPRWKFEARRLLSAAPELNITIRVYLPSLFWLEGRSCH